jgi:predicted outer membrane repeat protein
MKYPLLILALLTSTALADTWTVDDDGKADFDNIQAAVDAASDGDEIIVMPGTYTSTATWAVVDMLGKAVWLHSNDGPEVTIIDCENSRGGIWCWTGESSETKIEGLTVTNGYGGMYCNESSPKITNCIFDNNVAYFYWMSGGGGMYNDNSSPTLTNCTFSNNSVGSPDGGAQWDGGGGMYNIDSSPILNNCIFENNTAGSIYGGSGGGMYNQNSNPTLTDCTFTGNIALGGTGGYGGGGGAIYNDYSNPTLTNCTFTSNMAKTNYGGDGGGIFDSFFCNTTLTNCTFTNNTATGDGGGVSSSPNFNQTVLEDCIFINNSAGQNGGGLYYSGGSGNFTSCTFTDNVANDFGGGIYGNGTITDCSFINNTATNGGGGFYGNGVINDCDFSDNSTSNGDGGGIFLSYESSLTNCTLISNNAAQRGGGIFSDEGIESTLINCSFQMNSSQLGGGLYCDDGGVIDFIDCSFSGNIAESGGGAYHDHSNGSHSYESCEFTNNEATLGDGGGIYVVDVSWQFGFSLINCTLNNNSANTSGGGIYILEGYLTLTDCSFINNTATNGGGGLYGMGEFDDCEFSDNSTSNGDGGGIFLSNHSSLTNCTLVSNNAAQMGGGIFSDDKDSTLINCTFQMNSSQLGGGFGVFGQYSETDFVGCSFNGNIAESGGGIYTSDVNLTLTDTILCENIPQNIDGDYSNGGGNCVAVSCDDFDDDGWPDDCSPYEGTILVPQDYPTIQSAVEAAGNWDEIIIGPGTYTTNSNSGPVINTLGKQIWIHSSDGPEVTFIDGEDSRICIQCVSGETAKTIIEGFTITNGYASLDGGGMFISNSSPTLTNCTFTGNSANLYGGGMYNQYSSPTLTNCTFKNNTAIKISGGGMYNKYSDPTLTDCTFTGNTANSGGGGMDNYYSDPTLTNCTFTSNNAGSGSGMYNHNSSPTLTNCTFTGNSANNYGGGMHNYFDSSPTLNDCTFTNNAAADIGGGMINSWDCSPTLTNCTFENNTANGGGGMYNNNNNTTIENCTFTGNTAEYGGGMHNENCSPTLTDTTVCGNTPDQIDGDWTDNGGNTILDLCLIGDKDGDGVDDSIDNCYLYNPDQADCNGNGIGDVCDVADGTIFDCNANGVPDECDIANGTSNDVNGNGIPDECELDCNGNGVPDSIEVIGETKLIASDGASQDSFGKSVSISSDGATAIVGAHGDDDNGNSSGSAYIYSLEKGIWQETKLLASDGHLYHYFGRSVSISSDGATAIVGAPTDGAYYFSGSAYIYSLVKGIWQETKHLTSGQPTYGDSFGNSVSISSDGATVIVGAHGDDDNGNSSGSAYIYSLVNGIWQQTKLLASDGASNDNFGVRVSLSGDGTSAIVGANGDDDNGSYSGSAYIYSLVKGIWQETKLLASDGATQDYFGNSVSISSDGATVIVGARGDDDNGTSSGSAYIYSLVKGIWQETKLLASDGASHDYFGDSVSISSDGATAIVGAYGGDNYPSSGSAYIYSLVKGIWQETKLLASDGATQDYFGNSVSISSDGATVIVGAHGDDDNGTRSGSAYIYLSPFIYSEDCNANGVPDECDIADGTSNDVNGNGIPDECELDCNGNGVPDHWDIKTGASEDCQPNGIPDECDIEDGTSTDWNENGIPDECEVDCNSNGYPDDYDIEDGTSTDWNENGIPDECEVDCNSNGYPDDYDIQMGWSDDVNIDGIPDECQCIADLNNDGEVNVNELLWIISGWGTSIPAFDINQDGIVDVSDLLIVVGNWGPCE